MTAHPYPRSMRRLVRLARALASAAPDFLIEAALDRLLIEVLTELDQPQPLPEKREPTRHITTIAEAELAAEQDMRRLDTEAALIEAVIRNPTSA